ncbi:MAG TPA: DNA-processing protein DprA [Candidatus Saccharimonadia bacterium]|nr:DNA-processing protein DprA [Candidatus Saccharimonadia bacterium]
MQISNISHNSNSFPDILRQITEPPRSINVLGTLPKDSMVAVVGTRRPTAYGERVTYQIAGELAKAGAVIVSGLAIGVDSIAHRAALDAGGRTVAVLAHGLDRIYPPRHRGLAKEILASGGALVSEYDIGTPAHKHHFVERNRLIAGLCAATIVTEAATKSGSLITAHRAAKYNRLVMAVPGNITSVYSAGPNNLIRTNIATPITSTADAIVALGFHAREAVPVSAQSPDEAKILELLEGGASNSEDLIAGGNFSAAQFANIISLMEITGKVRNLGAGQWVVR